MVNEEDEDNIQRIIEQDHIACVVVFKVVVFIEDVNTRPPKIFYVIIRLSIGLAYNKQRHTTRS